jgi:hypothetical protein
MTSQVKFERCSSCGAEKPVVFHHTIAKPVVFHHTIAGRCEKHVNYAGFPSDCDSCRSIAGIPSQIEEEVDKLRAHAARCEAEAARLTALHTRYPGLKKQVGRWNKVAYCATSANARVDRFDIRHNCGCCSDSTLEVWPYVEVDHVYSNPACFRVGNKAEHGDVPLYGWDVEMREAKIPETIIGAVKMHFGRRREALLAEAEDLRARAEENEL